MIRARTLSFLLVFLMAGTAACGDDDDDGTGVDIMARISGSWQAQSFTYTNDEEPSQSIDVITQLQGALNVTIQESGAFSGTVSVPPVTGQQAVPVSGTLDIDGNHIHVDFDQQTEGLGLFSDFDATFTLGNNNNTFTWTATDVTFDFDLQGPGAAVASDLTVVLARTSS